MFVSGFLAKKLNIFLLETDIYCYKEKEVNNFSLTFLCSQILSFMYFFTALRFAGGFYLFHFFLLMEEFKILL